METEKTLRFYFVCCNSVNMPAMPWKRCRRETTHMDSLANLVHSNAESYMQITNDLAQVPELETEMKTEAKKF